MEEDQVNLAVRASIGGRPVNLAVRASIGGRPVNLAVNVIMMSHRLHFGRIGALDGS